MKSPATILRLWNKLVKKHEGDKDPRTLPRTGQDQKSRIKKDLTSLRVGAAADMADPKARQQFVAVRDRAALRLRRYCRYLKTSKDEDKKALPQFLRSVKQLTVVVEKLDPGDLDTGETDAGLDALKGVDTAALDAALEKPPTEAEGADLDAPLTADREPGAAEEAVPPAPAPKTDAAQTTGRLKTLAARVIELQAGGAPAAAEAKLKISEANMFVRNKEFARADSLLDAVEQLLRQPPTGPGGGAVGGDTLGLWRAAREAVDGQIGALQAALRATRDARFERIAEFGLNGVTKNLSVGMQAALMDFDMASGEARQKVLGKVLGAIDGYKKLLKDDPGIRLCDDNPFGVKVTIRRTLAEALLKLEKAVKNP